MQIKINVPVGKKGRWEVQEFKVTKKDADWHNLRSLLNFSGSDRRIEPGKYKRLVRNNIDTIMSNTPAEIRDCYPFIQVAEGNILINGLGLGVLLAALLKKKEIKRITVIEIDKDVIALIAPSFKSKKLTIINDNAYEWNPPKGVKYDFVWHDIWDTINADNLEGMEKLHRKYGKRTKVQASWCKKACLRNR